MFAWNRAEALVTLSLDYYLRVRAVLNQNHIRLQSKQIPVQQKAQHRDSDDMLQRPMTEYYIYVHKEDLQRALDLIHALGPEQKYLHQGLTW